MHERACLTWPPAQQGTTRDPHQPNSTLEILQIANDPKPKGPASYFPSIEKTYGHPVAHWFAILDAASELKHMELVALLKSKYKLGHGHANALVAHHLQHR